jgi:hypothetical protein
MAEPPRIGSREFRRTYIQLTEPTDVTATGRVIGRWMPAKQVIEARVVTEKDALGETKAVGGFGDVGRPATPAERQARTDAILGKVNRSRKP